MKDLTRARELLLSEGYTCVLCLGEDTVTSSLRGVRPLLELAESGRSLKGYSAADKVVGRATAFLYVILGVGAVYASVISRPALEVLERYGVYTEYGALTENIINRSGDGVCPFEAAVLQVDSPEEAYSAILRKAEELKVPISRK